MKHTNRPDAPKMSELLTTFRRNHNLSAYRLAALLGVEQSTISRWEHETRVPDSYDLVRLALVGLAAELEQAD